MGTKIVKQPAPKTLNWRGALEVPTKYFYDDITLKDVLNERNADVRGVMIQDLYPGGATEFYRHLIESGKGEIVLEPINKTDYQHARVWQIDYDGNLNKYLQVINQTKESIEKYPGDDWVPAGHKTTFLGLDPTIHYETVYHAWSWTFGLPFKTEKEFKEVFGDLKLIET